MKRLITGKTGIKVTAALLCAMIFALGQAGVFAATDDSSSDTTTTTPTVTTKIIQSTRHVENFYNAFGVCYLSTERSYMETQTTSVPSADSTDENAKTTQSTTITESYVVQTWKGGSLKPDYSTSTSTTTADDGSGSVTESRVDYSYDSNGRLSGAVGTAHTVGQLADDANGESGGSYVSDSTTTYIIKNAQALPSQTTTHTVSSLEGQVSATTDEVTNYTYELIGGAWHIMSEVTNSNTTRTDGGSEQMTTVKTYTRDANGVCTGISQTKTGTSTSVSQTGGKTTYTLQNYVANFQFDPQQGFYLASESYDWVMDTSAASSSSTESAASETALGDTSAATTSDIDTLDASATDDETITTQADGTDTEDAAVTHAAQTTNDDEAVAEADDSTRDHSWDRTNDDGWSGSHHSRSTSEAASDIANIHRKKLMPIYNEKHQEEVEEQILKFQRADEERRADSDQRTATFQKQAQDQAAELEQMVDNFRRATRERRTEIRKLIEQFQRNFGANPNQFMYQ